jgi:hypothetical protein
MLNGLIIAFPSLTNCGRQNRTKAIIGIIAIQIGKKLIFVANFLGILRSFFFLLYHNVKLWLRTKSACPQDLLQK